MQMCFCSFAVKCKRAFAALQLRFVNETGLMPHPVVVICYLRLLSGASLQVDQRLFALLGEYVTLEDFFLELANALIEPCCAGRSVLAVEAPEVEARLLCPFIRLDVEVAEHVVGVLAVLPLCMQLHASALVKHLAHWHAVEGGVLLESRMALIRHLNNNSFGQIRLLCRWPVSAGRLCMPPRPNRSNRYRVTP